MYAVFQLGRYIKHWQKAIIAKWVCVYLFIGLDVPIIAPSLWGQLGESQKMRPTHLLPLQLKPLVSDPINTTHLLRSHQFSHPPRSQSKSHLYSWNLNPKGTHVFLSGWRKENRGLLSDSFLLHNVCPPALTHAHTHTHACKNPVHSSESNNFTPLYYFLLLI